MFSFFNPKAVNDYFFQDNDGRPDGDPNGSPAILTVPISRLIYNDKYLGKNYSITLDLTNSTPGFSVNSVTQKISFSGDIGRLSYQIVKNGSVVTAAEAIFVVTDRTIINPTDSSQAPLDGIVRIISVYDAIFGSIFGSSGDTGTGFYVGEKTIATNAHVVAKGMGTGFIANDIVAENANLRDIGGDPKIALSTANTKSVASDIMHPLIPEDFATVSLPSKTNATVFGLEVYIDFDELNHPLKNVTVTTAGYPADRLNKDNQYIGQMVLSSAQINDVEKVAGGFIFSDNNDIREAKTGLSAYGPDGSLDSSGGQSGSPVFVQAISPSDISQTVYRAIGLATQATTIQDSPSFEATLIAPISIDIFQHTMQVIEDTGDKQPDSVWNKLIGSDKPNNIPGGPFQDIRVGNGGLDTFSGRPKDFDGDQIEELEAGEVIQLEFVHGTISSFNVNAISVINDDDPTTLDTINIDVNGDPEFKATFQARLPEGASIAIVDPNNAVQTVDLDGNGTPDRNYINFQVVDAKLGYGFSANGGVQFLGVDGLIEGNNLGSPISVNRGIENRNIAVTDDGRIFTLVEVGAGENDVIGIPPIFRGDHVPALLELNPADGSIKKVTQLTTDFGVSFMKAINALAPLSGGGFLAVGEWFIGSSDRGQDVLFTVSSNGTTNFLGNLSTTGGGTVDGPHLRIVSADTAPDGRVFVWQDFIDSYGGGRLYTVNPVDGAITLEKSFSNNFEIQSISFTPDGRLLATGGDENQSANLFEINLKTGQIYQLAKFSGTYAQQFDATGNVPPATTAVGTPGADYLTGTPGPDVLFGGAGNDIIIPGPGPDTMTGGSGNDTFAGTLFELANDIITDFLTGDQILILNSILSMANLSIRFGSAILDIDEDLDGIIDGTITLEGDFDPQNTTFNVVANNLGNTSITLVPTNFDPTATDDSFTVNEDASHLFTSADLLANDSDPDVGDTLSIRSFYTEGLLGSVVVNNDGTFTFTPDPAVNALQAGESIVTSFSYTIDDGNGGTDIGKVDVTILGTDDPTAFDDVFTTGVDQTIAITADQLTGNDVAIVAGDLDVVDLDSLNTVGQLNFNAQGELEYTPPAGFEGDDFFGYTIQDPNGGTDSATVTISVLAGTVNTDPIATDDGTPDPTGFITDEDTQFTTANVLLNDADVDSGDVLSVSSVDTTGTVGLVTDNGDGTFDYDPNGAFETLGVGDSATDSFVYTVSDASGGSDTAVVSITVQGVNDDPDAIDDAVETVEDNAVIINVLNGDSDPENDNLTVVSVGAATSGTPVINSDNTIRYTPNPDFFGIDSFTYTVDDGHGGIDTAIVTVTVTQAPNQVPNASPITMGFGEDETGRQVDLLLTASDLDGDDLGVENVVVTTADGRILAGTLNAEFGLLTLDDGQFDDLSSGSLFNMTVTYDVTDGLDSVGNTATITITGTNDDPIATDDGNPDPTSFVTDENTQFITANVLLNDTDIDSGDVLSINSVDTTGTVGLVTDNGDGTFEYDPNGAFETLGVGDSATDSFFYTVSDGNGGSDIATITINIVGVNDIPVISSPDSAAINENIVVVGQLAADDADAGDTLVTSIEGGADAGRFVLDPNGVLSFVTAPDFESPVDLNNDNVYEVTVGVSDGKELVTQDIRIMVSDVDEASPLSIIEGTVTGAAINEGSLFTRTITFSDGEDAGADGWTYSVDWGDGSAAEAGSIAVGVNSFDISRFFADGDASHTVSVTVTDTTGDTNTRQFVLGVNNVAPVITLIGDASVDEGSAYTLTGSVIDPGTDTITDYIINWGDGTTTALTTAAVQALSGNVSHIFADGASNPLISVDLVDEDGTHTTAGTLSVAVNNVAPTIAISGASEINTGTSYTLNLGAITDPGDDTVIGYIVNWGDGTVDTFSAAGDVTHVYTAAGSNTISVDLIDEDGTHVSAGNLAVTVNAPTPAEIIRIGDAPLRVSRSDPNAWENAWSHAKIAISHKADYLNTTETWSSVAFHGNNAGALSGGDIFGGDLGVSGQTLASSTIRQEIDGTEALRFNLDQAATKITIDLSRLDGNSSTGHFDAGRLQLLDDAGLVVDELIFNADAFASDQQITLEHGSGFSAAVLTAGVYNGTDFIFGGLSDSTGQYQSDPQNLGNGAWNASEYLVDAVEFEFGEITLVGTAA